MIAFKKKKQLKLQQAGIHCQRLKTIILVGNKVTDREILCSYLQLSILLFQ